MQVMVSQRVTREVVQSLHGQRGMKRGAAEKMREPARAALGLKKIARADHHDILKKGG